MAASRAMFMLFLAWMHPCSSRISVMLNVLCQGPALVLLKQVATYLDSLVQVYNSVLWHISVCYHTLMNLTSAAVNFQTS